MAFRLEISSLIPDSRSYLIKQKIISSFSDKVVKDVSVADVYTIDKLFSVSQLKQIASLLSNPVTQKFSIDKTDQDLKFDWAIETGFLPGVTDNVANTAGQTIGDYFKGQNNDGFAVYTSVLIFISGPMTKDQIVEFANTLFNPLIQRVHIKSYKQFIKDGGMDKIVPKVELHNKPEVIEVDLEVSDDELEKIGREGVLGPEGLRRGPLALDLSYMKAIQSYFQKLGRKPKDIEIETLAQTWSEHCKHTIFADPLHDISEGIFKRYIKKTTEIIRKQKGKKDICVSVFTDNSGAIEFDENYLITHKVETHNSPSALDPFGGAITGIVGVNRDTVGFGLGAKPVANTYGFCFADPDDKVPLYRDKELKNKMLSPRRIMDGVIAGVNAGGNQSGIPTPMGFLYFDERYKGKPLVFCGTVGLIPKEINGKPSYVKQALPGDYIVMVGGRVGLDGVHGATFSSESLTSGSPSTAVQIGDPITQKKFSDAIVKEARDLDLYNSITDNGAGGLSSSIGEMAKESGGFKVEIDKVPLKYPGLDPWQTWISESQERMTLAIPKKKWLKFKSLMEKRGAEATVIGEFTDSEKGEIFFAGEKILELELDFLHEGLPKRDLEPGHQRSIFKDPQIPKKNDLNADYLKMLSRLNFSGFEFVSTQFDHEVQGNSVLKPLQGRGRINSEVAVFSPVLNSKKGVALSHGLYPLYSEINTYDMAACSIDSAIRNLVTVGVDLDHIALLDNFCWCSSTETNRLGQLRRAARACFETAVEFGTPFISGKDSMFNDFKGFDAKGNPVKVSIPPTLLISSIGILPDVSKTVSMDFKFAGDLIYVLGETHSEMGGSEFYMMYSNSNEQIGHRLPRVNVYKNKLLYNLYLKCLQKGLISSAVALTRGGLGIGLAKSAMAGMLGCEINLKDLEGESYREDFALFSESQGRILISINPKNKKQFESLMNGSNLSLIGYVSNTGEFNLKGFKNQDVVSTNINMLLHTYRERFKNY